MSKRTTRYISGDVEQTSGRSSLAFDLPVGPADRNRRTPEITIYLFHLGYSGRTNILIRRGVQNPFGISNLADGGRWKGRWYFVVIVFDETDGSWQKSVRIRY